MIRKAVSPTVCLTVFLVLIYVFVIDWSLCVSASEISSIDRPAFLARVAAVCPNL